MAVYQLAGGRPWQYINKYKLLMYEHLAILLRDKFLAMAAPAFHLVQSAAHLAESLLNFAV